MEIRQVVNIPSIIDHNINGDLHIDADMRLTISKSAFQPCCPSAGAYLGFSSTERLGIFLFPP